ncbi:MAG: hypothetical protein NE330_19770 [Lentisphaeraceae bacterium]|nr:hypothetical protein [Lentisphaeraceae bacterium]
MIILYKKVNGKKVKLTPEEITQRQAEIDDNKIDPDALKEQNKTRLEKSCLAYQVDKLDVNLKDEMDKCEYMWEEEKATTEELSKAAENGYWLESLLWGEEEDNSGFYYSNKNKIMNGEDFSTDPSEVGDPPHTYKEIRKERLIALAAYKASKQN